MRPIRTIAPLTLGLVALAVAGCQSRPDPPPAPVPTPIERAAPATTAPAGQTRRPTGRRPVPPQAQARPGAGDRRRPVAGPDPGVREDAPGRRRRRPPALAALAGAGRDLLCRRRPTASSQAVARRVGPAAYDVGAPGSEWVANLHLAQPVRQGAGGIWVVTRIASPEGSY